MGRATGGIDGRMGRATGGIDGRMGRGICEVIGSKGREGESRRIVERGIKVQMIVQATEETIWGGTL
jgi:hypothetical protein